MFIRAFDPDREPADRGLTVADVIDAYLEAKELLVVAGMMEARSLAKTRHYCAAFRADFGHLPVAECNRGDLKKFLSLHPEYESPHTKHDAAGVVVTAFRWAVDEGTINACPYARPKDLPAIQPRHPIKAHEVRLILADARHGYRPTTTRFRLALWFLWETGIRTCDLYGLRWEHYDDERGAFELAGKTTRKTGRLRLIALPARAWRLVRWLRRHDQRPSGPVFLNGRGRAWNGSAFGGLFRRHADRAGVRKEVSAYCLRHGFTCEALEGGADELQLAYYLGHTSTKYVHWYGRGIRSNVDYLRGAAEKRKRKE